LRGDWHFITPLEVESFTLSRGITSDATRIPMAIGRSSPVKEYESTFANTTSPFYIIYAQSKTANLPNYGVGKKPYLLCVLKSDIYSKLNF